MINRTGSSTEKKSSLCETNAFDGGVASGDHSSWLEAKSVRTHDPATLERSHNYAVEQPEGWAVSQKNYVYRGYRGHDYEKPDKVRLACKWMRKVKPLVETIFEAEICNRSGDRSH